MPHKALVSDSSLPCHGSPPAEDHSFLRRAPHRAWMHTHTAATLQPRHYSPPRVLLAQCKGKWWELAKHSFVAAYVKVKRISFAEGAHARSAPNLCWRKEIWLCLSPSSRVSQHAWFMNTEFSCTHLSHIWSVTERNTMIANALTMESHIRLTRKQVWTWLHGLRLPKNLNFRSKNTCASNRSKHWDWLQSLPWGKRGERMKVNFLFYLPGKTRPGVDGVPLPGGILFLSHISHRKIMEKKRGNACTEEQSALLLCV